MLVCQAGINGRARELLRALGSASLASAGLQAAKAGCHSPAAPLAEAGPPAAPHAKAAPRPAVAPPSEPIAALRLQLPPSPTNPGPVSQPCRVSVSLTATPGSAAAAAVPAARASTSSRPVTALSSWPGLPEVTAELPDTAAAARAALLLSPPRPHQQQQQQQHTQQRGGSAGAPSASSCTGGGVRGAPPAHGESAGGSRAVAAAAQQQLPNESSREYESDSYWLDNDDSGEGASMGATRWVVGWSGGHAAQVGRHLLWLESSRRKLCWHGFRSYIC